MKLLTDEELIVADAFLDDLKTESTCNEIETLRKTISCYQKAKEEYLFFSKKAHADDIIFSNVAKILGLVLNE